MRYEVTTRFICESYSFGAAIDFQQHFVDRSKPPRMPRMITKMDPQPTKYLRPKVCHFHKSIAVIGCPIPHHSRY